MIAELIREYQTWNATLIALKGHDFILHGLKGLWCEFLFEPNGYQTMARTVSNGNNNNPKDNTPIYAHITSAMVMLLELLASLDFDSRALL